MKMFYNIMVVTICTCQKGVELYSKEMTFIPCKLYLNKLGVRERLSSKGLASVL